MSPKACSRSSTTASASASTMRPFPHARSLLIWLFIFSISNVDVGLDFGFQGERLGSDVQLQREYGFHGDLRGHDSWYEIFFILTKRSLFDTYIYTDAINESRWSVSYHTSCFGTWKGFHVLLFFSILGMRLKSVAQLDTEVEVLYVEYSAQYVRNGGAVWLAQRGEKYAENVSVVIPGCGYISQLNLWDLLAS